MSPHALRGAIEDGTAPAILDVRTRAEYGAGHVRGAINVPFNEVNRRAGELDVLRERPLLVYCGHGPRAWIAGALLRRAGFRNVTYLRGHWAGWRRARLRVERSRNST